MRLPITAPLATEPSYGLIAAAAVREVTDVKEWLGATFFSEGCGDIVIDAIKCAGNSSEMSNTDQGGNVEADAYFLAAEEDCTTLDGTWRDFQARARRALLKGQSFALARELWEGDVAAAQVSSPNLYFTSGAGDSDTVTSGADDPVDALACLVQYLGSTQHGGRGMIHMTTQLLVQLAARQAITQKGSLWVTPMEHIVVADAGYTGSGPTGTPASSSQWMYASPLIDIALGPITYPGSEGTVETIIPATNDRIVWAQRPARMMPQNACGIGAAQVDVGVCAIGGGS